MRTRRSEPDRHDVVARRLALLSPVPVGELPRRPLSVVRSSEARRAGARPDADAPDPAPSGAPGPGPAMARGPGPTAALEPMTGGGPGPRAALEPGPGRSASPERPWWDDHTRVRPRLPVPPLPPAVSDVGPPGGFEVPLPGRHASRRATGVLPPTLRWGAAHVAVLAVLVALGLALASWWVVRSEPVPVAAPTRDSPLGDPTVLSLPTGPGAPAAAAGSAADTDDRVVVDVAGEVRRPGVLELPAGSRVVDAIEAAGGARPGVDLRGLNLARVLVDGEQVLVGRTPATTPGAVPPGGSLPGAPAPGPGAPVDLNTADLVALDALPEIGPVTAQAILTWREEHGGFTAVQELLEVDGIGPATLETVAPLVTV